MQYRLVDKFIISPRLTSFCLNDFSIQEHQCFSLNSVSVRISDSDETLQIAFV